MLGFNGLILALFHAVPKCGFAVFQCSRAGWQHGRQPVQAKLFESVMQPVPPSARLF